LLWQNLQATYKLTVKLGGVRSAVVVPMLKENELAGAFVIYRQEVNPFTEKQIELVKNFAWTSHASFGDRASPNINPWINHILQCHIEPQWEADARFAHVARVLRSKLEQARSYFTDPEIPGRVHKLIELLKRGESVPF
jgi:GAF domain